MEYLSIYQSHALLKAAYFRSSTTPSSRTRKNTDQPKKGNYLNQTVFVQD
jgi:hypothetical protein